MEGEVLSGAATLIERHRPIMLIEWIKTSKAQLQGVLESFGYLVLAGAMNLLAVHRSDLGLAHIRQSLAIKS